MSATDIPPTNSKKRTHESTHKRSTRRKLSASPSSNSDPSISENSALVPTSHSSVSTAASDLESDLSSELSESSDEPSSESSDSDEGEVSELDNDSDESEEESNDEIIIIGPDGRKRKPDMKVDALGGAASLKDRLKTFLPKLAAANQELEIDRREGRLNEKVLERGGEDKAKENQEQYIEMDLGLGVLEEKDPIAGSSSEAEISEDEEAESAARKEKDVLGRLMGQERRKEDVGIQVVEDE